MSEEARFCGSCRARLEAGAGFCGQCGRPFAGQSTQDQPTPTAAGAAPEAASSGMPPIPIPVPMPIPGGSMMPGLVEGAAVGAVGGAQLDGQAEPQDEAAVSAPDACPRCRETLIRAKISGQELRACRSCGGVWMGADVFADLVRTAPNRLEAADTKFPNLIGVGWNRVGPKRCPQCGQQLREAPVTGVDGVMIDRCMDCNGVWFDDGELAAVVSVAQRRARARPA